MKNKILLGLLCTIWAANAALAFNPTLSHSHDKADCKCCKDKDCKCGDCDRCSKK